MAGKIKNKSTYFSDILPLLLFLVDYIAILFSEKLALFIRIDLIPFYGGGLSVPNLYFYIIIPLIFILFLAQTEIYTQSMPFWAVIQKIFWAVVYGVVFSVALIYFGGIGDSVSRLFVLLVGVLVFICICIGRYQLKNFLKSKGWLQVPVLFLGAGLTAELVVQFLENDTGYGYKILGFVDDRPKSIKLQKKYKILSGLDKAESIIKRLKVKHVIITIPGLEKARLFNMIASIQPHVKYISYVPDLIGTPMGNLTAEKLFDSNILMLKISNNLASLKNQIMKRCFDLIISFIGLILIVPIFLILTVCICLDSEGAPIYSHWRVGKHGKCFPCYKFRTMVKNSDEILKKYLLANEDARLEWEKSFKLKNDPRVTKIGHFLRRTSLDEIPQIINVLKGEMSLVGPRPIVKEEIRNYHINIKDYYLVSPGITGVWQVNGRSDTTYDERVAMDTWYVRNWSVWLDLIYLFKTASAVVKGKGAY